MEITQRLRDWLRDNVGMARDASDELVRSCTADAMASGKLSISKLAELCEVSEREAKEKLLYKLKAELAGDGNHDDAELLDDELSPEEVEAAMKQITASAEHVMKSWNSIPSDGPTSHHKFPSTGTARKSMSESNATDSRGNAVTPNEVLFAASRGSTYDAGSGDSVRVKGANYAFSKAKEVGLHTKYGTPVLNPITKRPAMLPSEYECAKLGAWAKWMARKAGDSEVVLSDIERDCVHRIFTEDKWCGAYDGVYQENVAPDKVRALLDDGTSGGSNLIPEYFDTMWVSQAVLFGELFPLVDVVNIPRGSTVETAEVGHPTITSGPAEGTAMTPFTTTGLVSQIQASVFEATCAIEVGRNFLSDSVVDAGAALNRQVAEKFSEWLEKQIANGDGTSEPEGIFNASGTNTFSYSGGTTGPPTVQDYVDFVFAIGKQYRKPSDRRRVCFVGNDTSYSRARRLQTGVTGDERLALGMDVESYNILQHKFCIQQDISNANVAFGNLRYYRLWRRLGLQLDFTDQGNYLRLRNLGLLTARGRFAGRVMIPQAFAVASNAQS